MSIINMILIPISGAIIGYFTNWLAIKMLFLPHNEVRIGGFKLPFTPGLIPKERYRLADKVSEAVSEHLLTKDVLTDSISSAQRADELADKLFDMAAESDKTIGDYINASEAAQDIVSGIEAKAQDIISDLTQNSEAFWEANPGLDNALKTALYKVMDDNLGVIANLFVNRERVYKNIKESLFLYLKSQSSQADKLFSIKIGAFLRGLTPEKTVAAKKAVAAVLEKLIQGGAAYAAEAIDVRELTKNQINSMDLAKAEDIVITVAKRELDAITYLGGVLGFIIGLLPVVFELLS